MSIRLSLAVEPGGFAVPETGTILVFHPRAEHDLSALPKDRLQIIQPLRPEHDHFADRGYACHAELNGAEPAAAAVVFLPRSKAQGRALIARAVAATTGPVLVDGAKTDGIDSVVKDLRKRADCAAPLSKAHGKAIWFIADQQAFADWAVTDFTQIDGFVTRPGVFSADGIDPASRLLVQALPQKIGRHVADLGAGWGYLSAEILTRDRVETLHLVEADAVALDCARHNIREDRARFHWADARDWTPPQALDAVVMNPPFHTGRAAEPALGQAFIATAARALAPSGSLWLVANRHLPYETVLSDRFVQVSELAGDNRFKVLHASRPRRLRG